MKVYQKNDGETVVSGECYNVKPNRRSDDAGKTGSGFVSGIDGTAALGAARTAFSEHLGADKNKQGPSSLKHGDVSHSLVFVNGKPDTGVSGLKLSYKVALMDPGSR